jgi:hypothetical protein
MKIIVAGIDVGGPRKGFHAVALSGETYLGKFESSHAAEVAAWCRQIGACVVAIDASSKWRPGQLTQED